MTIQQALESGANFKCPGTGWLQLEPIDKARIIFAESKLSYELNCHEILRTDWEIDGESVTITKPQLRKALVPIFGSRIEEHVANLGRALGFK